MEKYAKNTLFAKKLDKLRYMLYNRGTRESDFWLSRFNIDLKDVCRRVFIYVANSGWGCSSALLLHDKKRMKMQSYQNGW